MCTVLSATVYSQFDEWKPLSLIEHKIIFKEAMQNMIILIMLSHFCNHDFRITDYSYITPFQVHSTVQGGRSIPYTEWFVFSCWYSEVSFYNCASATDQTCQFYNNTIACNLRKHEDFRCSLGFLHRNDLAAFRKH